MNPVNFKIVFLFSGQGTHYRGMGQWLFENNKAFRNSLEQSDLITRKQLNRSLIEELYFTKQSQFDDLLITHPAIVAVELAMYAVLMVDLELEHDFVAGNSIGEFASATVCGIWSPEMAVEAAIEQAKSICRNNSEGGMLAVIGHDRKSIEELYTRYQLFLGADNYKTHFTLAGKTRDLELFQQELTLQNIFFLRLPVAYPFHSPLIGYTRDGFDYYMASITPLEDPAKGFVSGIRCTELDKLEEKYFWDAVCIYIDFPRLVRYLESKGPCFYIDLGPSGTTAAFVRHNLDPMSSSQTYHIMSPFKNEGERLKNLKKLFDA
jgi:bacillaene synthase trans-acting acyltransferase